MRPILPYLVGCKVLPNSFTHGTNELAVLGQGGAMAIEDAVCIARLLPADTSASEIEERLEWYGGIRYKRAEYVREQTRRNGLDEEERSSDAFAMLQYCYQHDEWSNTDDILKARLVGK
jgi:2-polyprenyl-6-methoxyphenol hydroxylase-like FAD-dependent oxidoreductase